MFQPSSVVRSGNPIWLCKKEKLLHWKWCQKLVISLGSDLTQSDNLKHIYYSYTYRISWPGSNLPSFIKLEYSPWMITWRIFVVIVRKCNNLCYLDIFEWLYHFLKQIWPLANYTSPIPNLKGNSKESSLNISKSELNCYKVVTKQHIS